MNPLNKLNGSWEAYEERKIKNGENPLYFSPEQMWEFDYLVSMIQSEKPHLDQLTVILAVREGMRKTMAPRPRMHFVDLVMKNIRERELQWSMLMENIGVGVTISRPAEHVYIAN